MKALGLLAAALFLFASADGVAKSKKISVKKMLKELSKKVDASWNVKAEGKDKLVLRKEFPLDIMVMGNYDPSARNVFEAKIEILLQKKWSKERYQELRKSNEAIRQKLVALDMKYPESEMMKNKMTAFKYWNEKRALLEKVGSEPVYERGDQSVLLLDNVIDRVASTANRIKDEKAVLKEVRALKKKLISALRRS
jgi:hypothetical protein